MKFRITCIGFLVFTLNFSGFAQKPFTELIISGESKEINQCLASLSNNIRTSNFKLKLVSDSKNIYSVKVYEEHAEKIITALESNGSIKANYDRTVDYRIIPNDEFFSSQWSLNKIRASDAWINATGGKDSDGNNIVIAVLDDGFDINHEDLVSNIFTNVNEIPNDGIDNDNNGYIDDYQGYNVDIPSGTHPVLEHGTSVLGIIGASSDNQIGIAGVNWNAKLLPISGVRNTSAIISAYGYIKKMKELYISSNGQEGANIVVTSFSGGVPYEFPDNFPYNMWCELYDDLGKLGILSVAATTNEDENVDILGDMASTCTSPFLIVTNATNSVDKKASTTGYSSENVDIGAPGVNVLTTKPNNAYNRFDGTSAATPHVAGAIALMYSLSCDNLSDIVKEEPSSAATIIKEAIYAGGQSISDLEGITFTGKRLDVLGTMNELQDLCDGNITIASKKGPVEIESIYSTGDRLNIDYITPDENNYFIRIVNNTGKVIYHKEITPQKFSKKTADIPMTRRPTGMYYITIEGPSGIDTKSMFYTK